MLSCCFHGIIELTLAGHAVFNTDTNHSVVQTYNVTTYKLCDYDNAVENDTIQWSSADPSNTAPHDVSVAVPLVKEGITYFFSGDYDGEQCKNGQHFKINVTHGQGLPKSLEQNPESSGPASSPQSGNGDDEPTPDTIVPNSNFNNPKQDAADDTQPSGSVSLSLPHVQGNLISILVGLVYLCCSWSTCFYPSLLHLITWSRN